MVNATGTHSSEKVTRGSSLCVRRTVYTGFSRCQNCFGAGVTSSDPSLPHAFGRARGYRPARHHQNPFRPRRTTRSFRGWARNMLSSPLASRFSMIGSSPHAQERRPMRWCRQGWAERCPEVADLQPNSAIRLGCSIGFGGGYAGMVEAEAGNRGTKGALRADTIWRFHLGAGLSDYCIL